MEERKEGVEEVGYPHTTIWCNAQVETEPQRELRAGDRDLGVSHMEVIIRSIGVI